MIGKISIGSSFSGCINYCLEDKKQELSQEAVFKNRAELIVFNQCFGDKRELAEQFNDVRWILIVVIYGLVVINRYVREREYMHYKQAWQYLYSQQKEDYKIYLDNVWKDSQKSDEVLK